MRTVLMAFAVGILATAIQADTIGEEDGLIVNRINATDFEVVETQDMSPRAFWCGAATLIERREGKSNLTEIALLRPRGSAQTAPGRKGVVFTTDVSKAGTPVSMLTVDVRRTGQRLQSYQARGFCRDAFTRATK